MGKFAGGVTAKRCWAMSTNFWKNNVDITRQCFTSSNLSRQWFKFSLKMRVMGLNPGYLFKSFPLYQFIYISNYINLLFFSLQNYASENGLTRWSCVILPHLVRYFHLSTFFWMFIEGKKLVFQHFINHYYRFITYM